MYLVTFPLESFQSVLNFQIQICLWVRSVRIKTLLFQLLHEGLISKLKSRENITDCIFTQVGSCFTGKSSGSDWTYVMKHLHTGTKLRSMQVWVVANVPYIPVHKPKPCPVKHNEGAELAICVSEDMDTPPDKSHGEIAWVGRSISLTKIEFGFSYQHQLISAFLTETDRYGFVGHSWFCFAKCTLNPAGTSQDLTKAIPLMATVPCRSTWKETWHKQHCNIIIDQYKMLYSKHFI